MPSPKRKSGSVVAIDRFISAGCCRGNSFPPRSAQEDVARSSTVEMIAPSPLTGRPKLSTGPSEGVIRCARVVP
jgi:hypothetical protein